MAEQFQYSACLFVFWNVEGQDVRLIASWLQFDFKAAVYWLAGWLQRKLGCALGANRTPFRLRILLRIDMLITVYKRSQLFLTRAYIVHSYRLVI